MKIGDRDKRHGRETKTRGQRDSSETAMKRRALKLTDLSTFATLATEAANFSGAMAESINSIVTQSTEPD